MKSKNMIFSLKNLGVAVTLSALLFPGTAAEIGRYSSENVQTDSIGNRDATTVGSPSIAPAFSGNGILTDSGSYAVVPNVTAFSPRLGSFTVAMQFRLDGLNHGLTFAPLLTMQAGDFADGVSLSVGSARISVIMDDGTGVGSRTEIGYNLSSIAFGAWHGIANVVDRDADLLRLFFFDGTHVASTELLSGSIDPTSGLLFGQYDFGFARDGHPRFVARNNLIVDEVRLFDTALPSSQATSITAVAEPNTHATIAFVTMVAWHSGRRTFKSAKGRALNLIAQSFSASLSCDLSS
jgi:hypothetical protein